MEKFTPPEPLNLEAVNLSDTWKKWKQRFEVYSLASGLNEGDAEIQAATLLHMVRPEAL